MTTHSSALTIDTCELSSSRACSHACHDQTMAHQSHTTSFARVDVNKMNLNNATNLRSNDDEHRSNVQVSTSNDDVNHSILSCQARSEQNVC
jgi:hypothetical protein